VKVQSFVVLYPLFQFTECGGVDGVQTKWHQFLNILSGLKIQNLVKLHTVIPSFDIQDDRASWYVLIMKPTRCCISISKFIFGLGLYMFRTISPSNIRSLALYTQQWYMSYRLYWLLAVWHIPIAVCTVLDSWCWMEKPSETCRVLIQN